MTKVFLEFFSHPDLKVFILSTCRDEIIQDFSGVTIKYCLSQSRQGAKKKISYFHIIRLLIREIRGPIRVICGLFKISDWH
jgi:hypothetical protein